MGDTDADGGLEYAAAELPGWEVRADYREGLYTAASPTVHVDGITVHATTAQELVERVRCFVRILALAMGRQGSVPVGRRVAGVLLDGPAPPREAPQEAPRRPGPAQARQGPAAPPVVSLGQASRHIVQPGGRAHGFEGDACDQCGAMMMVRNGSCLKCTACGTTTGCS